MVLRLDLEAVPEGRRSRLSQRYRMSLGRKLFPGEGEPDRIPHHSPWTQMVLRLNREATHSNLLYQSDRSNVVERRVGFNPLEAHFPEAKFGLRVSPPPTPLLVPTSRAVRNIATTASRPRHPLAGSRPCR